MLRGIAISDPSFLGGATSGPVYTDSPDNYASLVRWYMASDYDDDGLADNDPVVNDWPDHSAAAVDATPDGTYPPHYRASLMPSGKSCISFPDGWHHFDHTELNLGDFTVLAIWKPAGDVIIASSTSGNYQIRETSGGTAFQSGYLYPAAPPALVNSQAGNMLVWSMESWRRNGATGVPSFGYNKSYVGEDTGDTNTATMKCNTIGLYNGGLPASYLIAEICIFNAVLLDAEVDSLFDGYFNIKYATDIGS